MNRERAMALIAKFTPPKFATGPALSLFDDLGDDDKDQVRKIMERVQAGGLLTEPDPQIPNTLGIGIDGYIWRLSVVTNPTTGAHTLVVLDPRMQNFAVSDFLNILPETSAPEAPAAPILLNPTPALPDTRELLADLLAVQKECLAELKALKTLMGQHF